jgi:hypothetical protein
MFEYLQMLGYLQMRTDWEDPTWNQIAQSSVNFPAAREQHTAVYNPSTNKMVVFGGLVTVTSPLLGTNDVFVLNQANGQ